MEKLKQIYGKFSLAFLLLFINFNSLAVTAKSGGGSKIVGLGNDVKEVKGNWDLFSNLKSGLLTLFKDVKWLVTIVAIGMFVISTLQQITQRDPDYGGVFKNLISTLIILGVVWGIEVIINLSGTTVDPSAIDVATKIPIK